MKKIVLAVIALFAMASVSEAAAARVSVRARGAFFRPHLAAVHVAVGGVGYAAPAFAFRRVAVAVDPGYSYAASAFAFRRAAVYAVDQCAVPVPTPPVQFRGALGTEESTTSPDGTTTIRRTFK